MEEKVKVGKYRHFKGGEYEVIGVARHSEAPEEEFVVYKALYDQPGFGKNQLWIRPKKILINALNCWAAFINLFKLNSVHY